MLEWTRGRLGTTVPALLLSALIIYVGHVSALKRGSRVVSVVNEFSE